MVRRRGFVRIGLLALHPFLPSLQARIGHARRHQPNRANGIVVARNVWKGAVIYKTIQQEALIVIAPDDKMIARALVTAPVLRLYRLGQPARVKVANGLREGRIYSLGVEAVRVELQGAVYYLDVIIDRSPTEPLRPSETVEILLP